MKLINPLSSTNQYVYHYTKLDTALDYILKNGTLKLNTFINVNDPRENKSFDIAACVRSNLLHSKEYDRVSADISNIIKRNAKLACFSRDRDEAVDKWQPEALLDRGYARPSMWHHYGNEHKGVCLMFDRDKLNNAFKKQVNARSLVSGKVDYSDDGVVPSFNNDYPYYIDLTTVYTEQQYFQMLQDHLNTWLPDLFFRKLKDWSNEEEYRWLYFDDNPEPIYKKFDDSLEAIIVGERVPKEHKEDLYRYCAQYEAETTRLEWRNGYPAVMDLAQPFITHQHLLDD